MVMDENKERREMRIYASKKRKLRKNRITTL